MLGGGGHSYTTCICPPKNVSRKLRKKKETRPELPGGVRRHLAEGMAGALGKPRFSLPYHGFSIRKNIWKILL